MPENKEKSLGFLQRARLATKVATKIVRASETKGDPVWPRSYWGSIWNGSNNWGTIQNALWGKGLNSYTGSNVDYVTEVGDLATSSMAMACWQYIGTALTEAPPMVRAFAKGDQTGEIVEDHPLVALFKQPNDFYDSATLMQALALDWLFSGDVYWIKVREKKYLTPVELWYVPYFMMQPAADPNDKTVFIKQYIYTVDGVQYPYPVQDIVHLQRGINPRDLRRGIGVFDSVLREIYTDNMASNFSAAILKNWGVVPFVISPPKTAKGQELSAQFGDNPETAKARALEIKQQFIDSTTGDQRGKPIVNTIPLEITKLGFSPTELDISALRKVPESRIAAVSGLPASLLQFLVGLENGTSYASYKEAREQAYESVVVPLLRTIASTINKQLMGDFGDPNGRRLEFSFDLSSVRVLQDDQDKLFTRANIGVQGGWLLVSDARSMVSLAVEETDKIFLRNPALQPLKHGEEPPPPTSPEPLPNQLSPADQSDQQAIDGEVISSPSLPKKPKPRQLTAGKDSEIRGQLVRHLVEQLHLNGHSNGNGNGNGNGHQVKYSDSQLRDGFGRWTAGMGTALFEAAISMLRSGGDHVAPMLAGPTALDKRLVDYKPDRNLSEPGQVMPITEVLTTAGHDARLEYYSQMPFLDTIHELMGVKNPNKVDIEDYVAKRDAFFKSLPVVDVPLDHIVVTQENVNTDRVQQIREHPETAGNKNPYMIRFADETYVINGHHRIVSDVLDSKKTIKGHLLDFGWDFGKGYIGLPETKYSDDQPRDSHGRFSTTNATTSDPDQVDHTADIQSYLKALSEFRGDPPAGFKYNSVDDLVLKQGQPFETAPLPANIPEGRLGLCYMNAYHAVEANPELTYVEGFAQTSRLPIPLDHAWAVTKDGKVVDPTWNRFLKKGESINYFGVKIPMDVVRKTIFSREKYGVLHNIEQNYPLLRTGVNLKYSEDQPRDERGRWTDGHGAAAGTAGPLGEPNRTVDGKLLPHRVDSRSRYTGPDGKYLPSRVSLHRVILDKELAHGVKSDNVTVYMTGGGPASGKTTAIINHLKAEGLLEGSVKVDPDGLKEGLPEYGALKAVENPSAASAVHEESSDLSKQLLSESLGKSFNTLYDTTGDSSVDKLESKIEAMRDSGAKYIKAEYAFLNPDTAVMLAEKRAQEQGRHVDEAFIRETHKSVSQTFPEAIARGLFDSAKLWDTNDISKNGSPKLVATYEKATGLKIHDKVAWAAFKAIGREE